MFSKIQSKNLILLTDTHEAEIGGRRVKLSPKEMGVLELLMERRQTTVSRKEILEKVWGDEFANDQGLTQAISKLRGILAANKNTSIRTIPKKGYSFQILDGKTKRWIPRHIRINLNALLIFFLLLVICLLVFVQRIEIRIDDIQPNVEEKEISKSGSVLQIPQTF